MTMLDRLRADRGDTEDTVRIARKDFSRRRRASLLRRRRPLIVSVLVLALVLVGAWLVFFSSAVAAEKVRVTGAPHVATARVERVAAVPLGTPLARIDLAAIKARVETIPSVRSAEVSRSFPHEVAIAITERTPVAVIDQGSGLRALDRTGHVFLRYGTRPLGLPLVRTDGAPDAAAIAEAGKVAGSLPPDVAAKVDYVQVATVDDIRLRLKNGRSVIWGSSAESARKAQVLVVMLRRKATQIDVSVPERPTTRG